MGSIVIDCVSSVRVSRIEVGQEGSDLVRFRYRTHSKDEGLEKVRYADWPFVSRGHSMGREAS